MRYKGTDMLLLLVTTLSLALIPLVTCGCRCVDNMEVLYVLHVLLYALYYGSVDHMCWKKVRYCVRRCMYGQLRVLCICTRQTHNRIYTEKICKYITMNEVPSNYTSGMWVHFHACGTITMSSCTSHTHTHAHTYTHTLSLFLSHMHEHELWIIQTR